MIELRLTSGTTLYVKGEEIDDLPMDMFQETKWIDLTGIGGEELRVWSGAISAVFTEKK